MGTMKHTDIIIGIPTDTKMNLGNGFSFELIPEKKEDDRPETGVFAFGMTRTTPNVKLHADVYQTGDIMLIHLNHLVGNKDTDV